MSPLPKPVRPSISNILMLANQVESCLLPVVRAFNLAGKLSTCFFNSIQALLEKLRRFNTETFRTCQECFQSEVKTSDFTRLDLNLWNWFSVNDYGYKQLSQGSAFNGGGLDLSFNGSGVPKLIHPLANPNAITAQKFIASLLESERLVFLDLLKTGRSNPFLMVLKEQLIGFLNPLANILHSLRAYLLPESHPLALLSDVSLKPRAVQVFAKHPVVPFVDSNATVPDYPRHINDALKVSVPMVLIKFELQGFHVSMIT